MKRHIAFLFAALLGLSSCSALAELGQSTGSQRYQDGIYAATSPAASVLSSPKVAATRPDNDVTALTQKTKESKIYLHRGQADTLFIPEGKVAQYTFNRSDNSTVVSVMDADDWLLSSWNYGGTWSLYPDWYGWGWTPRAGFSWGWGGYSPWFGYGWRAPWRYAWYGNPWYWDSWYWHRYGYYGWHDPWYCDPWHWHHRPGPRHHHHGWHRPIGRNGQHIAYTPRSGVMEGSFSGGIPSGGSPSVSRRQPATENPRGMGTMSTVRRSESSTARRSSGVSTTSGSRSQVSSSGQSQTARSGVTSGSSTYRRSGGSSSAVRTAPSSSGSDKSATYRRGGSSSSSSSSGSSSSSYGRSRQGSSSSSSYSRGGSSSGRSSGGYSRSSSGGGRSSGGGGSRSGGGSRR